MTTVISTYSDSEVAFLSDWVTPPNGGAAYQIRLLVRVQAQGDSTQNASTLTCELFIDKDQSFDGFIASPISWGVVIDGVVVAEAPTSGSVPGYGAGGYGAGGYGANSYNPYDAWPYQESWSVWEGDVQVPHDETGEKTVVLSASYNAGGVAWLPATMTISGNIVLPKIDLATVPSVPSAPALAGDTVTIVLDAIDPGFVHDVFWSAGTLSGTIAVGVVDSVDWVVPDVISQFGEQYDDGSGVVPITIDVITRVG